MNYDIADARSHYEDVLLAQDNEYDAWLDEMNVSGDYDAANAAATLAPSHEANDWIF